MVTLILTSISQILHLDTERIGDLDPDRHALKKFPNNYQNYIAESFAVGGALLCDVTGVKLGALSRYTCGKGLNSNPEGLL